MWTFWSLQSQFHSIWVKCLHHVVWSLWIAHLLHLQTHLPSISLLTAIESTFASKAIGFTQVSLFMIIYSVNTYAVPKVEMLWNLRWHFLISFLWMISWTNAFERSSCTAISKSLHPPYLVESKLHWGHCCCLL